MYLIAVQVPEIESMLVVGIGCGLNQNIQVSRPVGYIGREADEPFPRTVDVRTETAAILRAFRLMGHSVHTQQQ